MSRQAKGCPDHRRYVAGCESCRARARRYFQQRYQGLREGTWERTVDGDALEHVKDVLRALVAEPGVTVPRVAEVSGISHPSIYELLGGKTSHMHPDTAAALLAVTAERARAVRPPRRVNSIGAARRLRALLADGWSAEALSSLCGASAVTLRHWRQQLYQTIEPKGHDLVARLYEKIQGLADPRGPSLVSVQRARELGYLPPECWADEDIDDPDAEPLPPPPESEDWVAVTNQIDAVLRDPRPGAGAALERPVKREMARQAYQRLGWGYERIAEVLGYKSPNAVEYLLWGRKDRPHTASERKPR